MIRLGVCISGGGSNLQAIIDACQAGQLPAQVDLVLSSNPSAYGLERAREAGIDHAWVLNPQDLLPALQAKDLDLIVLAGYLKRLPPEVIQAYPNGIINIHPSLIPAFSGQGYYGLRVHQAAIDRGVQFSGATVHLVNEAYDEGPILKQGVVPVYKTDRAEDLAQRVLRLEHSLLVEAIQSYIPLIQKSLDENNKGARP